MNRLSIILAILLLTSCSEISSTDPKAGYKYWSNTPPPEEIQVLEGQYWQSAHWTKEYTMYLKLRPTEKWWTEFINQNHLQIDNENWTKPTDAPTWFKPSKNSIIFSTGDDFGQGSRYFADTLTGVHYIYEIHL